jgi:hypothetical protein
VTSEDYYRPSPQQFLRVRSQRGAAIVVLNDWLDRVAFESSSGQEASRGRSIRLKMLVDLNATSSLPRLKRLADRLVQELEKKKTQPSTASADGESVVEPGGRARQVREAEDRLGDVLSAIAAILRQERFEPLLRSQMEKDAEAEIVKRLDGWLRDVADRVKANGGVVPTSDREWIVLDPITGYPVSAQCYGESKVGSETIRQILGWVDAYAGLPPGKKLDDEGMLPWPIVR